MFYLTNIQLIKVTGAKKRAINIKQINLSAARPVITAFFHVSLFYSISPCAKHMHAHGTHTHTVAHLLV